MRFARRSRCLSLCARFPPFAASSYDRSAVRVTTFAFATNGYSHNIYTVWSLYLIFLPRSCVSYLLQVRHLVSRSSYPLSYPLRLWCLYTNLPVLLLQQSLLTPPNLLLSSFLATSFSLAAICVRNPCLSAVIHASWNIVQWIYPSAKGDGWRQDAFGAGMYGYLCFGRIE